MKLLGTQFFSSEFIQALCWTLVHSLWQGVVLFVLTGLVVQFTRRSAPAVRYNLLATLFVLFIITGCFTFWREWHWPTSSSAPPGLSISSVPVIDTNSTMVLAAGSPDSATSLINAFNSFCTTHALEIVLVWFVLFALKCIRLLSGLHYVSRLRVEQNKVASPYWGNQVSLFCRRLQITFPVSLVESTLVKVPVVIGFFKPLILVPAGLLAQLPPDQMEAILLHELAHIRRRDYLVNMLQSFAEILFFFNPAVLWLSRRIRQERENCCDDIAIQLLPSKSNFLQALVSFQEYNFAHYGLAPSFATRQTTLTERVTRIIYNHNSPLGKAEKTFFALGIFITLLFALHAAIPERHKASTKPAVQALEIFLPPQPQQKPFRASNLIPPPNNNSSPVAPVKHRSKASTKANSKAMLVSGAAQKSCDGVTQKFSFGRNGIKYEVEKDSTGILALLIDGKPVSQVEIQQYENLMQELFRQYRQGEITIVVDGLVPDIESEPLHPIMVGFIKNGTITTNRDGTTYQVMVKNHKTVRVSINTQVLANARLQDYKALIDDLVQEAEKDRVFAELSMRAAEQLSQKTAATSPSTALDEQEQAILSQLQVEERLHHAFVQPTQDKNVFLVPTT